MELFTNKSPKYGTYCKFCNGKKIADAPALELPIVGEPSALAKKMQGKMLAHLQTHHWEQMMQGAALVDAFMSFAILSAFTHDDPSIRPRVENIRANIFQQVRKNSLNDVDLLSITADLGLNPDDAEKVAKAFRVIRDALCEVGQYAPAQTAPAPSPLVLTR